MFQPAGAAVPPPGQQQPAPLSNPQFIYHGLPGDFGHALPRARAFHAGLAVWVYIVALLPLTMPLSAHNNRTLPPQLWMAMSLLVAVSRVTSRHYEESWRSGFISLIRVDMHHANFRNLHYEVDQINDSFVFDSPLDLYTYRYVNWNTISIRLRPGVEIVRVAVQPHPQNPVHLVLGATLHAFYGMQHTLPPQLGPLRSYFRVHGSHESWNYAGNPVTVPAFSAGTDLGVPAGMANVPAGLDVVQAMVNAPAGRPAWLRRRLLVRLRRCDSARVPRTSMQVQKLTHKGACAPTALLVQVASIWNHVGINYDHNPTSVPTPGRFVLPPFIGP
jgi:hypothetical protein